MDCREKEDRRRGGKWRFTGRPFFCRRFPGKWKGYYGNLSTISHLQLVRLSPVRDRVRPDIDADGADEVVVGGAVKELLQEARLADAGVSHHNLLDE